MVHQRPRKHPSSIRSFATRPHHLVIVESPAKCKTLEKILSNYVTDNNLHHDYRVQACKGHVRNLSKKVFETTRYPRPIAGIDLDNNFRPDYEITQKKQVNQLKREAAAAEKVVLATDPDREGEAMAWHLQDLLNHPHMERVTFTELTATALVQGLQQARQVDTNLVKAQETRRVLDRLAGFTMSPALWKIMGIPGLSAGRVQSVGMALVVQRERERLKFVSREYATLQGDFGKLKASLHQINGTTTVQGAADLDMGSRHWIQVEDAPSLVDPIQKSTWTVTSVTKRPRTTQPPLPYRTSTLQQDASNRLGWSVSKTMRAAQELYEQGLITYMRTDSTTLAQEAQTALDVVVDREFGKKYVGKAKSKKKESKFSQEAHEGIRPALREDGSFVSPTSDQPLYRLIYQRTLASRMIPQVSDLTTILIDNEDQSFQFRASGSIVVEPGFSLVYNKETDTSKILPDVSENQVLELQNVNVTNHTTQPPARYTEASFVKQLETLGVGRPSTYAPTIQVLRDRAYVGSPSSRNTKPVRGNAISAVRAAGGEDFTGSSGSMVPSITAFCVTQLLEEQCFDFVDPSFTARVEQQLDRIAQGEDDGDYLPMFYDGEDGLAALVERMRDSANPITARRLQIPSLEGSSNTTSVLVGPWGPYVLEEGKGENATSVSLPPNLAADLSAIEPEMLQALLKTKVQGGIVLGEHEERPILVKTARYGLYLQWGKDDEDGSTTHTLPKHLRSLEIDLSGSSSDDETQIRSLSFEDAIDYVSLPRTVCSFNGSDITAAIGPYGPYLKYKGSFVTLKGEHDVLSVDEDAAIELVLEKIAAQIGEIDGSMVSIQKRRFGLYIKWKKHTAKLPDKYRENPTEIPLDEAWDALQANMKQGSKSTKRKVADANPKPKRPLSAYLHFCAAKRSEIKGKSLGETSKQLSAMWSALPSSDRVEYEELAAKSKAEYNELMEKWASENDKPRLSRKSTGAPKRPKSAYLYFCAAHRTQVSKQYKKMGEISKELARLWAETTDRTEYESLAADDKKRYHDELHLNENSSSTNKKKTKVRRKDGASKRAPSAYILFCSANRPLVQSSEENLSLGETTKRLARMWKEANESTKEEFRKQSDEMKAGLQLQL